jgi:hypothetical protein
MISWILSGIIKRIPTCPPYKGGGKNIVLASLRREVARSAGGFYTSTSVEDICLDQSDSEITGKAR